MKEMDYVVLLYAVGTAHIDMFTFKVHTLSCLLTLVSN